MNAFEKCTFRRPTFIIKYIILATKFCVRLGITAYDDMYIIKNSASASDMLTDFRNVLFQTKPRRSMTKKKKQQQGKLN
jgi:hypothetical protein